MVVEANNRKLGELVGNHVRIKQRGQVWHGTYQYEGKQIRVSFKTRNKKQAIAEATKINLRLDEGTYQPNKENKSSAEAVRHYLEQLKVNNREPVTINKYTRVLNRMLKVAEGLRRTKLSQIDLVFVDAYKLTRSAGNKTVGIRTIHSEVMIIRSFVNWVLARKYVKDDPLAGLSFPQPKSPKQPSWTWEQVQLILNVSPDTVKAAFAILAHTGMRFGELRWLRWDDIRFNPDIILIQPKEGWKPKSKNERSIPIIEELLPYIQALPRVCKWVIPMPVTQQQPVAGLQLSKNSMLKRLKRVLKKLGLAGHLHTFRHSFISFCAAKGIPDAIIREWVGHVDSKILRHYTQIFSQPSHEAMKLLSKHVKGVTQIKGGETKKSA